MLRRLSGEPGLHRDGNHGRVAEYDERSNLIAQTFVGLDGEPVVSANGRYLFALLPSDRIVMPAGDRATTSTVGRFPRRITALPASPCSTRTVITAGLPHTTSAATRSPKSLSVWTASLFPRSKGVCSNYFADGVGRFARCPSAEVFPTSALRNTMFYAPEANQLNWPLHCFDDRGGSGACARVVFVCRAPGRPSQAT